MSALLGPAAGAAFLIAGFALLRRKDAAVYLAFPLLTSTYFWISTEVFRFGLVLPFEMYSADLSGRYQLVLWAITGHFAAAYLAHRLIARGVSAQPVSAAFDGVANQAGRAAVSEEEEHLRDPERLRRLGWPAFLLCFSPVVLAVLAVGPAELIERRHFVPEFANGSLMRFADLSFWVSSIVTPFLRRKWMRAAVLVGIVFVFAAVGSRSSPVMLLVYVAVTRLVVRDRRIVAQAAQVTLSIALLALLLSVRYQAQGGLYALAEGLTGSSGLDWWAFAILGVNYMVNFSVTVNGALLAEGVAETTSFFYALLPLPSALFDMTTWYDSVNRFRVNIPYPGFGYALSYLGIWLYIGMAFFVHLGIELLRTAGGCRAHWQENIIYYGWLFLPFLVSLQYNLRTASRLFYVFLIVYIVYVVAARIRWADLRLK